ncbi:MAG: MBL fold metallo-hydrolase [Bacilli bacterium]|nr:MBL fold metallo-hydrolase [Bacilli bacterium]
MLDIITICDKGDNANTYIVGNDEEVIIVDPANRLSNITTAIKNRKVLGIFLTHGHYDHFITLTDVLNKYNVNCYIHQNGFGKLTNLMSSCAMFFGVSSLKDVDRTKMVFVKDNQIIELSKKLKIKVITTPGHTDCSVTYQIDDVMFTGDTLFNNGVGRTDLPTSNTMTLINSLKKLLDNKNQASIYPGHGWDSTLEEERHHNDFYRRVKG